MEAREPIDSASDISDSIQADNFFHELAEGDIHTQKAEMPHTKGIDATQKAEKPHTNTGRTHPSAQQPTPPS